MGIIFEVYYQGQTLYHKRILLSELYYGIKQHDYCKGKCLSHTHWNILPEPDQIAEIPGVHPLIIKILYNCYPYPVLLVSHRLLVCQLRFADSKNPLAYNMKFAQDF